MVNERQRWLVKLMLRANAFHAHYFLVWNIQARYGFGWLLNRIKRAQIVDDFHHAPCCPANHYHRTRLVFQPCTCGASQDAGS
jgi:hypothetical protein